MLDLDQYHADGWTISDLARIARVDFSTAYRWVRMGVRPASRATQRRLQQRGLWRPVTDVTVTSRDTRDVTGGHGAPGDVTP